MSNELSNVDTPIARQAETSVMDLLKRYGSEFAAVIPPQYTAKYFGGLVKIAIAQTPKLAGCTAVSFVNAVLTSASLGLPIRKNSAYLIPYGKDCQLVIDYHGKMDLARRAGLGAIHVEMVREGDDFRYGFDRTGLDFRWYPGKLMRGEYHTVFVSARINGDIQYSLMSLDEIEEIRARAQNGRARDFEQYGKKVKGLSLADIRALDMSALAWNSPYKVPWVEWYDRQARKTAIHRAAHDWPLSPQLMLSQEIDVANETGSAMPIDDKLATVIDRIDPADNRPMVDGGGDTFEEQRETLKKVGADEMAKSEARRAGGAPITQTQANRLVSFQCLPAALTAHGMATIQDVRQSQFDSVLAWCEQESSK